MTAPAAAPARFYGPHNTIACPDCGQPADVDFGDHGGSCRTRGTRTGPDIIRDWARTHQFLSINAVRGEMTRAGVPETKRGPAFTKACQRGWIEHVGFEPSTDPGTKRHNVKVYRSLLCPAAAATTTTEGR